MRNYIIIMSIGLLAVTHGCTFTTTKQKQPVLNANIDSLGGALNTLVQCEHLNINGSEITTNKKTQTVLEIDVINGKNIPAGDEAMFTLAKQIALQVKEFLANKNAYSEYKVLFVTQVTKGIATKNEVRGKIFKNEELQLLPQSKKTI